ncbi:MAG: response regulator [Clostridia bacterium]|nr:response regulator [Clostridia bacterium]
MSNKPFYKRTKFWTGIIAILLLFSIALGTSYHYFNRLERTNIQSEGQLRLSNIAGQVENSLTKAESYAEKFASDLEILSVGNNGLSARTINSFIHNRNIELVEITNGTCTANYVAYDGKLYMENFVPTAHFHLTEREWYVGALKNAGKVFITNPYTDANTGELCYSISKLLSDGKTIIGMDFTMTDIQNYIDEMSASIDGISIIVNESGTIIGHTDNSFVGKNYEVLDYSELIEKVFNLYGNYFEYKTLDGVNYTVFSDKTSFGWYPIVCIPAYIMNSGVSAGSLIVNSLIVLFALAFLITYILFYKKNSDMEGALESRDKVISHAFTELSRPVSIILNQVELNRSLNKGNFGTTDLIKESAEELSDSLKNLNSLTKITRENVEKDLKKKLSDDSADTGSYKRQGSLIITVLVIAAIVSILVNTLTQFNYVNARMEMESDVYSSQVKSWIDTNITLTNDMALHLGANPNMYEDYEYSVKYIDNVVKDNSDISVAYIVNPSWEHTVIMNNGWQPTDPNWHVESRDWYVDTILSENGFNISTPYKDEQTGMYCVTFSQLVKDEAGEIIGLVGIDFYMDTLINILGESYTNDGYAFLTDPNYIILNHPNVDYQMSSTKSVNAAETEYRGALVAEKLTNIKDFKGSKVALASREKRSGFTVVTVKDFWSIYSTLILSDAMLLLIFAISVGVIIVIIRFMAKWQERLNHKLKLAADEAIAAGKAKSDFLANMSHEIRTPINAVLGMNEMIMREAKDPVIQEYSSDIQSAGRTLLSIINDILDFSKIESGKMEIVPVDYDVSSVINDLVNMIATRAEKKGLVLNLDIDENLPAKLYGDDVRIRQIITNILTNAVKYTDKGSVTLTIKGSEIKKTEGEKDKIRLLVSVKDTGKGIRPEDMKKLFSSFTRIDERANRNIEGTGLGITITSRLLHMMDSNLEVTSEFGVGSEFYFNLEQVVVDSTPIGDYKHRFKESLKPAQVAIKHVIPKARILLVDDTEMNLKVETRLLKRTKAIVDTASGGRKALEMLKEQKYDIVFLDHMMPDLDGIETLQEAKKQNLVENTPVIALTANAIAGAKQSYLEAGFDDYLSKPVKGEEIEKMLFKYIRQELIEEEE